MNQHGQKAKRSSHDPLSCPCPSAHGTGKAHKDEPITLRQSKLHALPAALFFLDRSPCLAL